MVDIGYWNMDILLWCLMVLTLLASVWVYCYSISLKSSKKETALLNTAICFMLFLFQLSIATQGQGAERNFFTPWSNLINSEELGNAIFVSMVCFGGLIALISWLIPNLVSVQDELDNLDKK